MTERPRTAVSRLRRAAVATFAVGALGCHERPGDGPPLPRLDGVEVAGCAAIVEGPVCRVKDSRELRVLVGEGASAVAIDSDVGTPAVGAGSAARDGIYAIGVPHGATRLTVDAIVGGERRRFTMRLADAPRVPAWLAEARGDRARGALDDAERVLDGHSADASTDADVASLRARIALSRGDVDRSIALLAQSAEMHAAGGELSAAVDDEAARANLAISDSLRFAEARVAIARMRELSHDYAEGAALVTYTEGVLAIAADELHDALTQLEETRAHAARIGYARLAWDSSMTYADVLASIGRYEEASTAASHIEEMDHATVTPCDRADLHASQAWYVLQAREAPYPPKGPLPDPKPLLRDAAERCASPQHRANALVNLAWALLEDGDVEGARATLAEARSLVSPLEPIVALFALELDGRIALAAGEPRAALVAYAALAERAAGVSQVYEVQAAEGRSDALLRIGDRAGALASVERADAMLGDAARGVQLGEGRGAFWWTRARVARRRVALLIDAGRAADALDAVRDARAKIAADVQRASGARPLDTAARARWEEALADYRRGRDALAERAEADWSLAGDALARAVASRRTADAELRSHLDAVARGLFPAQPRARAPLARDDGTLALVWYSLGDSWAAFRVARGEVVATRVVAPTDDAHAPEAASILLASADDVIARARRLRILAFDSLRDIDIHALPFPATPDGGEPLLAHLPVEYALDAEDAQAAASLGPALIVADPTGTLPAARREGAWAAASVGADAGTRMLVGAEATRARVLAELPGASAFYYSGHAAYAGVDGWDSALVVANGERLAVGDLLVLPHAPRLVVLAGCETGSEGERGGAVGLGLAEAFVVTGARTVLASPRRVRDEDAEALMRALVPLLVATPDDPAAALQRAELDLRRISPSTDWSAFRALTR